MSTKYLAPKDWKFSPFDFRIREDLTAPLLIDAAPEWIFWEFMVTAGLFMSGSNTCLVRKRVKQHPAVSFSKQGLKFDHQASPNRFGKITLFTQSSYKSTLQTTSACFCLEIFLERRYAAVTLFFGERQKVGKSFATKVI